MKREPFWLTGRLIFGVLLLANHAVSQTWTQISAPLTNWGCLATSASGRHLVAAAGGRLGPFVGAAGPIYISTNTGASWTPTSAPIAVWVSVACSADGVLVGAAAYAGGIHFSTNSGLTWIKIDERMLFWRQKGSNPHKLNNWRKARRESRCAGTRVYRQTSQRVDRSICS